MVGDLNTFETPRRAAFIGLAPDYTEIGVGLALGLAGQSLTWVSGRQAQVMLPKTDHERLETATVNDGSVHMSNRAATDRSEFRTSAVS